MNNAITNNEFSKLRAMLWPIYAYELPKFLPMALMMAMILFDYSVLRALKDSFVVKHPMMVLRQLVF